MLSQNFSCHSFPLTRMRRNRSSFAIRSLVAENILTTSDLILPLFVIDGENIEQEIVTMPNVFRYSIDRLLIVVAEAVKYQIKAIMLFPVIDQNKKDQNGTEALNPSNLICRTISKIKQHFPEMLIICDVALDPYTKHGHDGIIDENGTINNDLTIKYLVQQAKIQAESGADFISPSDMMDGRVQAIRRNLDRNNFSNIGIVAYSAKYVSSFYGPFRDAVGSKQMLIGNKKSYQMAIANQKEALAEAYLDINEGADILIVKPAMPYLDIISNISKNIQQPIFTYQVSGEYAMIYFAAKAGAIDFMQSMLEALISMKRAGARAIITYSALEVAKILVKQSNFIE